MRKRWQILSLVVALILSPSPALAWGDTAHMVSAQIAYSRLNPTAKARLDQLAPLLNFEIKVYGAKKIYNSITVAAYMDDVRVDPALSFMNAWHFIDIPFSTDGTPIDSSVPEENVVTRIKACLTDLKKGGAKQQVEAELLGQLIHLVGDVHQPLHCAVRVSQSQPDGDRGGNLFLIGGEKPRLHSYWDAAGGLFGFEELQRPLNLVDQNKVKEFAAAAEAAYPETNPEWKEMDVGGWAKESFDIARSSAYVGIEVKRPPSDAYQTRTQELCRRRLAMAGYRLAALLNEIYPEDTNKPPIRDKTMRRKGS